MAMIDAYVKEQIVKAEKDCVCWDEGDRFEAARYGIPEPKCPVHG